MPTLVKPVAYGEDNPIENAPVLTDEDKFEIKRRMEILDKILATQQKAKYKIEILFASKRSTRAPSAGVLSFWESGSKLHGGGDAKMYMCPGKELGRNACDEFIPDVSNGYGFLVCPSCGTTWRGTEVIGEKLLKLSMRDWALVIYRFYIRLQHNADIVVKHPKVDIRLMSELEQQKQHMGDKLGKARNRLHYIYPLRNIIRDVTAGADPLQRFYAFLMA
jgi:hypothetical protein